MEPVLRSCGGHSLNAPVSQEAFLVEFKKVAEAVARRLKEQPVIVAHSENNFDGSGIKRLMSNKFELDKVSNITDFYNRLIICCISFSVMIQQQIILNLVVLTF